MGSASTQDGAGAGRADPLYGQNQSGDSAPKSWRSPFSDVSERNWFFSDVEFVYKNGLFQGASDTEFEPEAPMTRAMAVAVLYRAAGSPDTPEPENPFTDIKARAYYYSPVAWAAANGIIVGVGDGLFDPGAQITREQLATIMHRYAAYQGKPFPPLADGLSQKDALRGALSGLFTDATTIAAYAYEPVYVLARAGILQGDEAKRFNPKTPASRAQAAAVLRRFIGTSLVSQESATQKKQVVSFSRVHATSN